MGYFTTYNGFARHSIVRINTDGSRDTAFNPNLNAVGVGDILLHGSQMLIRGEFTSISSQSRNRIARLNSNGTLDAGFNYTGPAVSGFVTKIFNSNYFITTNTGAITKLTLGGAIDSSWSPTTTGINCISMQTDGKLIVSGFISTPVIGKQQCTVFGNQECTVFGNKSAQKMATRMHNG